METGGELPLSAPGTVFHPTDEDLVVYYLRRYVSDQPLPEGLVVPADVYGTEPWNLLGGREEAFFFCRRTRRSPNSKWPSRSAGGGSWQAFRTVEEVKSAVDGCGEVTVGVKSSLAYRHSEQKYSGWVMYEFELFDREITSFQELVLCHIKETRRAKTRGRKQPVTVTSDNCIDGNLGDVAAVSCCTVPPLKKRRINRAPDPIATSLVAHPSPMSSAIASRAADGIDDHEVSSSSMIIPHKADHELITSKPTEHGCIEQVPPLLPYDVQKKLSWVENILFSDDVVDEPADGDFFHSIDDLWGHF